MIQENGQERSGDPVGGGPVPSPDLYRQIAGLEMEEPMVPLKLIETACGPRLRFPKEREQDLLGISEMLREPADESVRLLMKGFSGFRRKALLRRSSKMAQQAHKGVAESRLLGATQDRSHRYFFQNKPHQPGTKQTGGHP